MNGHMKVCIRIVLMALSNTREIVREKKKKEELKNWKISAALDGNRTTQREMNLRN